MIQTVEKLLILQERDHRILRVQGELVNIEPAQQMLRAKAAAAQAGLDQAKGQLRQIDTSRDSLELEVKAKKGLIAKSQPAAVSDPEKRRVSRAGPGNRDLQSGYIQDRG